MANGRMGSELKNQTQKKDLVTRNYSINCKDIHPCLYHLYILTMRQVFNRTLSDFSKTFLFQILRMFFQFVTNVHQTRV